MAAPVPGSAHVSTLVCRVRGVGVGLDTDQLNGMTDVQRGGEGNCRLVTMHELFGLDAGDSRSYARPKVLFVKGGYTRDAQRIGVVVDEPEEIIEVPVDALRPMPALAARGALWAVAMMPQEMILMMDVRKTIARRMPDAKWDDVK